SADDRGARDERPVRVAARLGRRARAGGARTTRRRTRRRRIRGLRLRAPRVHWRQSRRSPRPAMEPVHAALREPLGGVVPLSPRVALGRGGLVARRHLRGLGPAHGPGRSRLRRRPRRSARPPLSAPSLRSYEPDGTWTARRAVQAAPEQARGTLRAASEPGPPRARATVAAPRLPPAARGAPALPVQDLLRDRERAQPCGESQASGSRRDSDPAYGGGA